MIFIKNGKEFEVVLFDGTLKCQKQLDSLFFNTNWVYNINEEKGELKIKNKKAPILVIGGVRLESTLEAIPKGNYIVVGEDGDLSNCTEEEFRIIFETREISKSDKELIEENKKLKEIIKLMSEFM